MKLTLYSGITAESSDVTNGTEDGNIIFSTRAAGSFGERLRITSAGLVGIATATPRAQFDVIKDTGNVIALFEGSNASQNHRVRIDASGASSTSALSISNSNSNNQTSMYHSGGNNNMVIMGGQTAGAEPTAGTAVATFASGGDVTVNTGNLVIGTSGKGIDFSAESGSAAGSSSALLDDYEQGSFTATMSNGVTLHSGNDLVYYIKVGNLVTIQAEIRINSDNSQADTVINNLPFVATNHNGNFCPGPVGTYDHQLNSGTSFAFVKTTKGTSTASFQCAGQDGTFRNLDARGNGYLAFTLVYFTTF